MVFGSRVITSKLRTDPGDVRSVAAVKGRPQPVDLCASKRLAGRPRDREFVAALVNENIVAPDAPLRRLTGGIDWPPGYLAESQTMLDRARGSNISSLTIGRSDHGQHRHRDPRRHRFT